jgi:hypothetical protein
MLRSFAFCMALTLSAVASASAVYKWVDPDGRVHYSDVPPSDKATLVDIIVSRPPSQERAPAPAASARVSRSAPTQDQSKQKADQAVAQEVNSDLAKANVKKCNEAKERYRTAIESHRLYKLGPNGERQYLSDSELSQARMDARRDVDESCGSSAAK